MTYRLSQDAKDDLNRIYQYGWRRYGEKAADDYFNAFFAHFEALAKTPRLHPRVDQFKRGYRRSVCGADKVYYREVDGGVEIMAIIGQQDEAGWL